MKKFLIIMLVALMFISSLASCSQNDENNDLNIATEVSSTTSEQTLATTGDDSAVLQPEEKTPEEILASMYYDDRITLKALFDKEITTVTIQNESVTSKKLGSTQSDSNVLVYDSFV